MAKSKKKRPKTYLAGPIGDVKIREATKWRNWITIELDKIGIDTLNPFGKYGDRLAAIRSRLKNWNKYGNIDAIRKMVATEIIPPDLVMVEICDFVTLWIPQEGKEICGSYGEMTFAFHLHIPVYIVTKRRLKPVNLPNWAIGCSTCIFKNWNDYFEFVKKEYENGSR